MSNTAKDIAQEMKIEASAKCKPTEWAVSIREHEEAREVKSVPGQILQLRSNQSQ